MPGLLPTAFTVRAVAAFTALIVVFEVARILLVAVLIAKRDVLVRRPKRMLLAVVVVKLTSWARASVK